MGQRILLAGLIILSAAFFGISLWRKVRVIAAGAAERPRADHPGERLRVALREVLLQTRVNGGRPVVGALHTVVFAGFLLFAVETVEHFLHGFGLTLLEPLLGPALPVFHALLGGVAVLVLAAILGLAVRRFVLVKISPDPRSWTSAVVALFIALLMVTYLNGMRAEPFAPAANWWLHALVILAFPHVILRSKHFHILLAPVCIFLRTRRLGEILPLDLEALAEAAEEGEVTLGLENVGSVPWKMRMDFFTCVECRRCTDNCPANLAGSPLDPRGFVLAGRRTLLTGAPGDPVIGPVIREDALATCVTCGACENACPVGVEHLQLLVGAKRAQALSTGQGVVASHVFRAIEQHGNPLAQPRSDRRALLQDLKLPRFTGADDQWLLWLGCLWGLNRDQRGAVAAFQCVLDAAGVRWGVLDDEPCCGHHSRRQGEEAQFQELGQKAIEILRVQGARRIVTPCPHCLHTLRRDLPPLDAGFVLDEVVHHSELMARLIAAGGLPLNGGLAGTVATYHDPCYLARFEGVVDAPRAVLTAAGVTVRELPHRRARTLCCGGGAAGFAREQRVDRPRAGEIAASGAKLLVTACPECRMMLNAATDQTRDLSEIVAGSLQLPHAAQAAGG
jgi:Fe-S oxidoreductase